MAVPHAPSSSHWSLAVAGVSAGEREGEGERRLRRVARYNVGTAAKATVKGRERDPNFNMVSAVCLCVSASVYMNVYVPACAHVCICMCFTCVYVCMCAMCSRVCVCTTCVCVCMRMCV